MGFHNIFVIAFIRLFTPSAKLIGFGFLLIAVTGLLIS